MLPLRMTYAKEPIVRAWWLGSNLKAICTNANDLTIKLYDTHIYYIIA